MIVFHRQKKIVKVKFKPVENSPSGFVQVSIQVIGLNHIQMKLLKIKLNMPPNFQLKQ
jgi:hypothetical protein